MRLLGLPRGRQPRSGGTCAAGLRGSACFGYPLRGSPAPESAPIQCPAQLVHRASQSRPLYHIHPPRYDTCVAQLPSFAVLESETMESSPLPRAGGRGWRVTRILLTPPRHRIQGRGLPTAPPGSRRRRRIPCESAPQWPTAGPAHTANTLPTPASEISTPRQQSRRRHPGALQPAHHHIGRRQLIRGSRGRRDERRLRRARASGPRQPEL